jgi:Fur family transcriptional regulator, ferric uptake regulator
MTAAKPSLTNAPSPPAERWIELAHTELQRAGHRSSAPRASVVELLGRQSCVLSAREISDRLSAEGKQVGIATVYRTLELLARMRLVQRLDMGTDPARYEPALPDGDKHHHHLVCEECSEVTAFDDPALERAIARLSRELDYRVGDHDVVLRGLCPDCRTS